VSGIGIKFSADGEREFKKALSEINQTYKVLNSEMKLVQSQFEKNDNSVEALTARNQTLNKQIDAQKDKISTLKSALENAAASFGENDKRTNAWRIQLNNAEAALNGMERELKKNEDEIKDAASGFNSAEKAVDKFDDEINNAEKDTRRSSEAFSKVGDVLKGIGAAIATASAAIGAATVAAGKKVWDLANETAAAGDTVDKMSQKIGMSASAYQEWDYVLSQSGVEIESMSTGFKTLTNMVDKAISGNDEATKSFEKLGISTKDLQKMSREDIFAAAVKGMQGMADTTERAALANKVFGRSGQELAPLFNTTSEATEDLKQKARDLGFVMSDEAVEASVKFTDSLDTLKRTFAGVKNSIVSELMPGLTSIMDGFSQLLAGSENTNKATASIKKGLADVMTSIKGIMPRVAEIMKTVFTLIGEALPEILPDLIVIVQEIISGLFNFISESLPEFLPQLLSSIQQLATELFNFISESLPVVLPQIINMLFSLLDTFLTEGLPTLLDSLMKVADSLLDSFLQKFPELLNKLINFIGSIDLGELLKQFLGAVEKIAAMIAENLPTIVSNLVNAIINLIKTVDWKELIKSGNNILLSLVDGFLSALPELIKALPELIDAIVDFLTDPETIIEIVKGSVKLVFEIVKKLPEIFFELIKAIGQMGFRLIQGLWEGIKGAFSWLWEKITGFFGGIVDGIKGFFGIHSPSTLFRDQIGKNLALGLGEGFSDEMKGVAKDMENAIPTDFDTEIRATAAMPAMPRFGLGGFGGAVGGNVTQTFNVSLYVDSISDDLDINDVATQISQQLAQEVLRKEGVYA
jgi:phage-related protein